MAYDILREPYRVREEAVNATERLWLDLMAASQVPWGLEALNGAVTEPAWKTKPS